MDDEALIASAKTRRDERMCENSRLFNALWLSQSDQNTWQGDAAISKIVRRGMQRYFGKLNNANEAVSPVLQSELTYIGKYAVNISEEKVLVGVKFEF